jgi:hypothetical protein
MVVWPLKIFQGSVKLCPMRHCPKTSLQSPLAIDVPDVSSDQRPLNCSDHFRFWFLASTMNFWFWYMHVSNNISWISQICPWTSQMSQCMYWLSLWMSLCLWNSPWIFRPVAGAQFLFRLQCPTSCSSDVIRLVKPTGLSESRGLF